MTDLQQEINCIYFAVYDKEESYNQNECLESFEDEEEALFFVNNENAAYGYNKLYYKEESKRDKLKHTSLQKAK